MKSIKKKGHKPEHPVIRSGALVRIPGSGVYDPRAGVGLEDVELPDYAGMAAGFVEKAKACEGFHPKGLLLAGKAIADAHQGYCEAVDLAASRLINELNTAYRASIQAGIRQLEGKLEEITPASLPEEPQDNPAPNVKE